MNFRSMYRLSALAIGLLMGLNSAIAQTTEYKLNLSASLLHPTVFKNRVGNFSTLFKTVNPNIHFTTQMDTMTTNAYNTLKNTLTSSGHSGDFFYGLHVYYGMQPDYSIRLLYVPLFADSISMLNGDISFALSPFAAAATENDFDNAQNVYEIINGNAVPVSIADAQTLQANYRKMILIDLNANGIFTPFEINTDVTAAFIPFQQLDNVFKKSADARTIYLTCIAEMDDLYNSLHFKQNIAISNTTPDHDDADIYASDMDALCPPNCPKISVYPISGKYGTIDFVN